MIAEAGAAISGIKVAMDMAKGIATLKSEAEINQAIIDIQRALLDAQSAALDDKQTIARLADELSAVKREMQGFQKWENEKARYVLTKSKMGAFTYDLRPESANGEVFHRLCVKCFESGSKSFLHTTANHGGGEIVECKSCKAQLMLADFGG